jgi:replication initiation and membrane attachment protein
MSILPADNYIVINKTNLNENDRKILSMLYQPIIGFEAISLYLTLWSDLDKSYIMSKEFTHHHLMMSMRFKLENIVLARQKLEAIGLLKTYSKEENIKSFVYELYAPLNEYDFFNHPILSVVLHNNIGDKEYEKIVNYYKNPKINLKEYKDITTSFNEIFDFKPLSNVENFIDDIRKKETNDLNINATFDFDMLIESLGKFITKNTLTDENKDLIIKLSLVYNIDATHMSNIVKSIINESGIINKEELRKKTKEYYQFEENGKSPSLVNKTQPSNLRNPYSDVSNKAKMIYTFETTTPYNFLTSKYNGVIPTNRDLKLLETLIVDHDLNPGVINVLIDYVLKVNNQKLAKEFIETIAGQWKRLNIKTVEEAMNIAESEHKKRKKYLSSKTTYNKKEEKLPVWFDQKLDEKIASEEDLKEIDELLSKY